MSTTNTEVATTEQQPRRAPIALGGRQSDFDTAFRLAKNLAVSSLIPKDLRGKPSDVLVILMYGQELGLAPMQAMQGVYVVNGRPSLAGQTWLALARKAGHRITVLENDAQHATVKVTRGDTGESHTETYTIEQAKRAGLTKKDIWQNHPERMLMWRATGRACTFLCPEIALGFTDAEPGELEPERPTLATVVAERTDQQRADRDEVLAEQVREDNIALAQDEAAMLAELDQLNRHGAAPDLGEPVDADLVDEQDGALFEQPAASESQRDRL
ncbi:hypothetical protein JOF56_011660 [Kibdelosporangium banguiense]|uniref:RecT family protein n=1 Tax=Kibdelosporangium banguiense TaxID=1365924 RepID=A0ABS4U3P4_9PSEU|nr:hypothetical protein [Kibdelosporangium banguiense]MBP2331275.1 hypothetical protein [Kibdelosporangium banguiense]